jgi:hypothetical protein
MPKTKEEKEELGKIWQDRITAGEKIFSSWYKGYKVKTLQEYYEGFHYDKSVTGDEYQPYISNRFGMAIDIKLPVVLFTNPSFEITPKPSKKEYTEEESSQQAQLKSDVLNQTVGNPEWNFYDEASLAILDAQTSFGIFEVNYDADWIENPNANQPILTVDTDSSIIDSEAKIETEAKELPKNERIFFKRIPAEHFRVSLDNHKLLKRCRWFGYWEFVSKVELISNPNYDTDGLNTIIHSTSIAATSDVSNSEFIIQDKEAEQIKLWKIWDMKAMKILFIPEGSNHVIREKPFKRVNVFPLKYKDLHEGFYPKPPAFDWLSPQREINETGEFASLHRKRAARKYLAADGAFDPEELEKLQMNIDMSVIKTKRQTTAGALEPIKDADLGAQHHEMRAIATNDFDNIASITAAKRGEAGRGSTATEASLTDKGSSIRDSKDVITTANWYVAIGREVLLQIIEKYTGEFWVKVTAEDSIMEPLESITQQWQLIKAEALGDSSFDIDIILKSLSPVSNDIEKRKYIEFVSIITQFPIVGMSPGLVHETANSVGYRNQKVIRILAKLAQAQQIAQLAQADEAVAQASQMGEASQGGEGNAIAQREVAQNTPPDVEEIRNQLTNFGTQTQ